MRVLVTGTQGYIGSQLAPLLQARGHDVTGVDTGYYSDARLYEGVPEVDCLRKDIRELGAAELRGYEAVVHLAELSNDPLGQLNPEITFRINHRASVDLAHACRAAGVSRFVYASSCSVYGIGTGDDLKSEESPLHPQTAYAECKVQVEKDVSALAAADFSPTFLRNATAYGASPRMRFDLVVNNLSGLAWTRREIRLTSDGTPWRPLVHLLDISRAIACTLEAPREAIHNQILNVGESAENYQVRDIASIIAEVFTGCALTLGNSDGDSRSYRVAFEKIRDHLPAFRCEHTVRSGAEELRRIYERIGMTAEVFERPTFTRLKQLKRLLLTNELNTELFWTARQAA